MAATGLQMNWASVTHGNTSITKVTDVTFTQAIQLTDFFGDTNIYSMVVAAHSGKISATVSSGDESKLMGIAPGTVATLSATHKDALKAASGDVVYSLSNAVAGQCNASGAYGQYGKSQITFQAFSSDGSTNPLSFTRA